MQRWWDWHPNKPVRLQNGVGRIVCLFFGHEQSRSIWCDWCGKQCHRT